MEWETSKILGSPSPTTATGFHTPQIPVSVHCNRVPVLDGHLLSLSLSFTQSPPPTPEDVASALASYTCEVQHLKCPSAPKRAIVVLKQQDRPQPRLDRMKEGGYAVSVGRIRKDDTGVFDIKMTVLVHNTVLGAAGSSLLIGEYCVAKGLL
jgi:aspartate-semialdehyde dehydrogenase